MSEPMNNETEHVIVVVKMADDIHHVLGRAAVAWWSVAAFLSLGLAVDLWSRDWRSAVISAIGALGFVLMGRDSWIRRRKYAAFVRRNP